MKRIFSTVIAIALLLGLGALAVLARGGGDILTPAKAMPVAFAAPSAQEDTNAPVAVPDTQSKDAAPEAVAAGINKLNNIGMPLIVQSQFTSLGLPFTASGLAKFIGRPLTDVVEVRRWNATAQAFTKCSILPNGNCTNPDNDFTLELNGNYMVLLTSALAQTVVSFVGDVPDPATVQFKMQGAPACKLNAITLPLHKASVTNAEGLAAELGGFLNVQELRTWNVTNQAFTKCSILPNGKCTNPDNNFTTTIGYPYWVCLKSSKDWP